MLRPRIEQRSRTRNCRDNPIGALAGSKGLAGRRPARQRPEGKWLTERPGKDVAWFSSWCFRVERRIRHDNVVICKRLNPASVNSAWRKLRLSP